jgi:BsuBI/PstI restriction endonuclease HTH domain
MTNAVAANADPASRLAWAKASLHKGGDIVGRWYAANTREPIRDETLREGLVRTGAATARIDIPTTSALPRYHIGVWAYNRKRVLHVGHPEASFVFANSQQHMVHRAIESLEESTVEELGGNVYFDLKMPPKEDGRWGYIFVVN